MPIWTFVFDIVSSERGSNHKMKARNILGFYAGVFLLCTLEIHGTPVRNLKRSDDVAKKSEHLLRRIRSALNQDENIAKNQLSELVDSDLLSYIEGNKQEADLEATGAKEVRANTPKKLKCKGQKPPEFPKPPQWPVFHGFNFHSAFNKDCLIGDLMLTPEECLILTKKIHH